MTSVVFGVRNSMENIILTSLRSKFDFVKKTFVLDMGRRVQIRNPCGPVSPGPLDRLLKNRLSRPSCLKTLLKIRYRDRSWLSTLFLLRFQVRGWAGKVEEENCQRAKLNPGGSFFRKKKKNPQRGVLRGGLPPLFRLEENGNWTKNIMKLTFFNFIPVGGWGSSELGRGKPPWRKKNRAGRGGWGFSAE